MIFNTGLFYITLYRLKRVTCTSLKLSEILYLASDIFFNNVSSSEGIFFHVSSISLVRHLQFFFDIFILFNALSKPSFWDFCKSIPCSTMLPMSRHLLLTWCMFLESSCCSRPSRSPGKIGCAAGMHQATFCTILHQCANAN